VATYGTSFSLGQALSAVAIAFPLFAIPALEVRQARIRELEAALSVKDAQLRRLQREAKIASRTGDAAAVSGVIF